MCMGPARDVIVHVTATDLPLAARYRLEALLKEPDLAAQQVVFHVGPGPSRVPMVGPIVRVHAPLAAHWVGSACLGRALRRRGLFGVERRVILHCWSATAAGWGVPLAADARPVVIEVASGAEATRCVCWPTSGLRRHTPTYVCPTRTVRQCVAGLGVPDDCCVLIRPGIDPAVFDRTQRAALRAALDLNERDLAIFALPPVSRSTGTLTATWAVLLLEKMHPEVRLVLPAGEREHRRLMRLVEACRHNWMVRVAGSAGAAPALLAAADLAVFLPAPEASVASLVAAMAAGCPLVASDTPAVVELLGDRASAWLCRPNSPEDAARQMLRAIENPDETRRKMELAHARAIDQLSVADMIAAYRRCYAKQRAPLAPGALRPPVDNVGDGRGF